MSAETYTTADGTTMHRWTDSNGQRWVCVEYDHGPLCRRCVRVDDTMEAVLSLVVDGDALVKPRPSNEPPDDLIFRLTDEGMRRASHLIATVTGDPVIDWVRERLDEGPSREEEKT